MSNQTHVKTSSLLRETASECTNVKYIPPLHITTTKPIWHFIFKRQEKEIFKHILHSRQINNCRPEVAWIIFFTQLDIKQT